MNFCRSAWQEMLQCSSLCLEASTPSPVQEVPPQRMGLHPPCVCSTSHLRGVCSWGQNLLGHSAACAAAAPQLPSEHLLTTQLLGGCWTGRGAAVRGRRELMFHFFFSFGNSALGSCSCLQCFPRSPFYLALLLGSIFRQFPKHIYSRQLGGLGFYNGFSLGKQGPRFLCPRSPGFKQPTENSATLMCDAWRRELSKPD